LEASSLTKLGIWEVASWERIAWWINFLPILGGQKAVVSDSVEGWCAAGNLGASRVLICMDDQMDGRMDDGTNEWNDASHHDVLYYTCILKVGGILDP
jgi:hypothetical protein